jgi:hypothetical protein
MEKHIYFKSFVAVAALAAATNPLAAGSFGSAGTEDARVGRYAGQTTIWCERLEASVPEQLFRDLDCGSDESVVRDAVAGERVTNRGGGLVGLLGPHIRGGNTPNDDDGPSDGLTILDRYKPTPETGSDDPVDKWDRLGELGVTPENFDEQSDSFKEQVGDYIDSGDSDWSGFNPS